MGYKFVGVLFIVVIALAAVAFLVQPPPAPLYIPGQVYNPTVPAANEKVVCIVFDDGWKCQLDALPVLERFNFTATFAIVPSYTSYPDYMNWQDLAIVVQKGNDIESHTLTHADLDNVDNATLYKELAESQQILRSKGYPANILIYPYGDQNETVRRAVAQYYLAARGIDEGQCNLTSIDPYNIDSYGIYNNTSMADFAAHLNGTQGSVVTLLYYHKINNENVNMAITKETFQAQMQYLKDNGYTTKTMSQLFLRSTTTPTPSP